jgi:hypothetical protein
MEQVVSLIPKKLVLNMNQFKSVVNPLLAHEIGKANSVSFSKENLVSIKKSNKHLISVKSTFNIIPLSNWDYILVIIVYNYPCYFSIIVASITSTTFTLTLNPIYSNVVETFGIILVRRTIGSNHIKLKPQHPC